MSTFIWKLVSSYGVINCVGSCVNSNANLSYMWKTFNPANRGATYTNQPITHAQKKIKYKQTPHTTAKCHFLSVRSSAITWWKEKSNITCTRSSSKLQPMRADIAGASTLLRSNKEWLGRGLLSWINIRGQVDLVNTHLLTFTEMLWIVVSVEGRILRWAWTLFWLSQSSMSYETWNNSTPLRSQSQLQKLRVNALFSG